MDRPRRSVALFAVSFLVVLLAAGCADVERTVVQRHSDPDGAGGWEPVLIWESDRYPEQRRDVSDDCWDTATVGMPPPESCLTPLTLVAEANPYGRAPWLSLGGSLIVAGALLWFALRRIAWTPKAEPVAAPEFQRGDLPSAEVVRLMRVVDDEKGEQAVAEAAGHEIANPAPVGAAVGAALLIPLILILGYATSLGWAIFTALLMLFCLGVVEMLLILPVPPRVTNPHPAAMRMLFLTGVAVSFLVLSIAGARVTTPLLDLHGVAWPL